MTIRLTAPVTDKETGFKESLKSAFCVGTYFPCDPGTAERITPPGGRLAQASLCREARSPGAVHGGHRCSNPVSQAH